MFDISKSLFKLNLTFFFIFLAQTRNIFSHDLGLFEVRTDLVSVEKVTFDYLKETSNYRSNPLRALIPQPTFQRVCNLSHESKMALCWSYLQSEEYKFEFTLKVQNDSLNTDCIYRKLSTRILDQKQLNYDDLMMFRCPQIAEDFFLKEAPLFYISDSSWQAVAIIFKQKNIYSPIHPHKYIREIDFHELKLRTELYIQYKLPLLLNKNQWYDDAKKNQMILTDYSDNRLDLFQRSIDAIEIKDPYAKFQAFYRATDVCGLDISQKVYLCREFLTKFDEGEDLFVDEYSDGRCLRISQDLHTKVSAFQCPPEMVYDRKDELSEWETMYSTSLHFLTKTVIKTHFIAIESLNRTWKVRFQAVGIQLQFLQKVRQIERDSLYPRQIEGHDSSLTSFKGKEKSYQFAFPIQMNRKMAENFVIQLDRIKRINSPYEKFQVTLSVQNICDLELEEKLKLCKDVFENQVFGYEIKNVDELKCNRKTVYLVSTRIIVPIRDFKLMVLSCSITQDWPPFKLHLSGSPEINSVLILDQSFDENELTARTVVRGLPAKKVQIRESKNIFSFFRR